MPNTSDGSRQKLLDAADELLRADPDQSLSVRAVCAGAGVQLPTLYHFFESKQGLLDALVERSFRRFADQLEAIDRTDPTAALRAVWGVHLGFAAEDPALYALMFGKALPAQRPRGYESAEDVVLQITGEAARAGVLSTSAAEAAWRLTTAASGAALALIADPDVPARRVESARAAVITGVTRAGGRSRAHDPLAAHAGALQASLTAATESPLGAEERALLDKWLGILARGQD